MWFLIPRKSRSFTELNVEILASKILSLEGGDEVRNKFEEHHLSVIWMKKQAAGEWVPGACFFGGILRQAAMEVKCEKKGLSQHTKKIF